MRSSEARPSCGRGMDSIFRGAHHPGGPFPRSCEQILTLFVVLEAMPIESSPRKAVFRLRCWHAGRCQGALELRHRGTRIGRQRFRVRPRDDSLTLHEVRIRFKRRFAGRVATLRIDGRRAYQDANLRVRLR